MIDLRSPNAQLKIAVLVSGLGGAAVTSELVLGWPGWSSPVQVGLAVVAGGVVSQIILALIRPELGEIAEPKSSQPDWSGLDD